MPRLTIALSPAALRTSASRRRSVAAPLAAVALACAAATAWAESPAQPAASTALDLRSFVQQIQSSNRAIKSKRTERDIAATSISRAQAAFDPVVSASTQRSGTRQQNTLDERSTRPGDVYERFGTDYSAAVSRLLSSGAKVEGKVTLSKFLTSTKQILSPGAESDVRSFYGVTVTQPLLRDSGAAVTGARVRVAEIDTAVATAASRDTESSVVAEALFAYWDLALAQHRLALAGDKQVMGERLLAQARNLNLQGRLSASEAADVQSNLAQFQAGLIEARMAVQERANRLRTLLMRPPETSQLLSVTEALPAYPIEPLAADAALAVARERRDDLRIRRLAIDREEVQVAYARNQAKPRVDVVAAYGLNGLGASERQALRVGTDAPTWNLGVQLSMPLGANRQGQADIEAARLRREDARLQLQAWSPRWPATSTPRSR